MGKGKNRTSPVQDATEASTPLCPLLSVQEDLAKFFPEYHGVGSNAGKPVPGECGFYPASFEIDMLI